MSAGALASTEGSGVSGSTAPGAPTRAVVTHLKVLLYSDDAQVRENLRLGLGTTPDPALPSLSIEEFATATALVARMDASVKGQRVDLVVLDGEAVPSGGMGLARQLKDEIYQCPPLLVITGRAQDGWLATWARADAVISHPIDPVRLSDIAVGLLRTRVA
jgi:DNA-binding LytR/AlgR family response regulator